MSAPAVLASTATTVFLDFFDETSGVLTDPVSVQLDITYGQELGFVPDFAGPFTYEGASSPAAGQIWRTGTGQYAFTWVVPANAPGGVYVVSWTCFYGGDDFLGTENIAVQALPAVPVPAGDTGYWTGGLDYTPSAATPAVPVSIEFGAVDDNGIAWLWQKITGWDGPDVQGAGVIPRSGDHGAWASPQFYAARQITLTITASAPTQALRDLARAQLQQAIPISDLAVLRYDEPVPKQVQVRRSGKITEAYPTLADVTFTCGLVAPDPRKYAVTAKTATIASTGTSSGIGVTMPFTLPFTLPAQPLTTSVAAVNAGTFETRPVITVTGPITSPKLVNVTTGQAVSWTGLTVPAGSQLVADFNVRQGLLDGVYYPADPFSAWWTLPPGTSTIQFSGVNDTGAELALSWQDAWI